VFDILVTIIGDLDDEAEILAFANAIEAPVRRARELGFAVEIRDNRLATIIRKRVALPGRSSDLGH
jgi:cell division FtsZ-interacting protein ZapD